MTIATAANTFTPTPNTFTPFPESVIIITMGVINIAELDIHVAELLIDNAELSISVSEFASNYPTVAGDNAKGSTSTLGKDIKKDSNAVSIAISRRRYPQQDNGQEWVGGNNKIEYNAYG